jgi:hypothetical protein
MPICRSVLLGKNADVQVAIFSSEGEYGSRSRPAFAPLKHVVAALIRNSDKQFPL